MSAATAKSTEEYMVFSLSLGGPEQVKSLLELASSSSSVRSSPGILRNMTRVLAALTYANHRKMAVLMDHFRPALDFNKFDTQHAPEDEQKVPFSLQIPITFSSNFNLVSFRTLKFIY